MRPEPHLDILFLCVAILVAALAIPPLISCLSQGFYPVQADETTLAWAGARASRGDVPYRDFFSILPPFTIAAVSKWFDLFGESLGALRWLEVAASTLCSVLLFVCLRRGGTALATSACASLLPPWLYFVFWPIPSHHYFAVAAALAALLLANPGADGVPISKIRLSLAAAAASTTFLTLQPEGTIVAAWIVTDELFAPGRVREKSWRFAAFAAGFATPLTLSALELLREGALKHAFYDTLVWPAMYYRRAGGFNDLSFTGSLFDRITYGLRGIDSVRGFLDFSVLLAGMLLIFLCSASVVCRAAGRGRGDIARLLKLLALFALFMNGRSEWVHLAMWGPFIILLGFESGRAPVPPWLDPRPAACLAMAVAAISWGVSWCKAPPDPRDVAKVDGWYASCGPAGVAKFLPGPGRQPVLYLPHGSAMYLYYSPDPPPLDWVMPPSKKCNAPWEYEMLASWCENRRVPFVLLGKGYEKGFMEEPSRLSATLSRHYEKEREFAWGLLLRRKASEPSAPAWK